MTRANATSSSSLLRTPRRKLSGSRSAEYLDNKEGRVDDVTSAALAAVASSRKVRLAAETRCNSPRVHRWRCPRRQGMFPVQPQRTTIDCNLHNPEASHPLPIINLRQKHTFPLLPIHLHMVTASKDLVCVSSSDDTRRVGSQKMAPRCLLVPRA
jgi:hypothetical protein